MPIVEIDGVGQVELDNSFTSMSARDQERTIHEITTRVGPKSEPPISSLSDLGGAIAQDFKNPPNELSIIGMAGKAYKAFTDPIPDPRDREAMRQRGMDIAMTASPLSAGSVVRRGLPIAASRIEAGAPEAAVAARGSQEASVPTREQLSAAANDAYSEARRLDLAMEPASTRTLSTNIKQTLDLEGFRDIAPGTHKIVSRLEEPKTKMKMTDPETGEVSTEIVGHLKDVLAARTALGRIAANPAEKAPATIAIKKIDTYLENLTQDRPAILGEAGPRAAELVGKGGIGPGNYAAAQRAKMLEKSNARAELNAASAGSGANIDNAIRQQAKSILISERKTRGLNQDELAQLNKIVKGTFVGNAARYLGKLAPTGIVSGGIVGGAGLAGGAPGILAAGATMAFGFSAKKLADHMTKSQWNKLDMMIRSRSPLGERMAAPLRDWVGAGHAVASAQTIQNYVRFKMASTNLANNLKDIGIRLNPGDLIRTLGQGPVPAPAENK